MDTFDTVFETASGLAGILALAANELVLGLGVAVGLLVWLMAGRKEDGADSNHRPHHP